MLLTHFCLLFLKTAKWEIMYFCQPCRYFEEVFLFCLVGWLWLLKKPPDTYLQFQDVIVQQQVQCSLLQCTVCSIALFFLGICTINPTTN